MLRLLWILAVSTSSAAEQSLWLLNLQGPTCLQPEPVGQSFVGGTPTHVKFEPPNHQSFTSTTGLRENVWSDRPEATCAVWKCFADKNTEVPAFGLVEGQGIQQAVLRGCTAK